MSDAPRTSGARFGSLDGLRAIAVGGPILHHLWPKDVPASPFTARVTHLGSFGVDLFFVLSGFLITWLLLEARDRSGPLARWSIVAAFYVRRFLRIMPLYWLTLIALALLGHPGVHSSFWWNFFYMSNIWVVKLGAWPGDLSHLWSLSVEEQFYLVWPLLVIFTPRRHLAPAFTAVFLSGPLWRALSASAGLSAMAAVVLPMGCMDDLAGGGLVALVHQYHRQALGKLARWCAAAGLVAAIPHTMYWLWHGSPAMLMLTPIYRTSVALCFMGLVARLIDRPAPSLERILLSRPVVYVGTISYGIYLQHLFVPAYLSELGFSRLILPGSPVLSYFIVAVVTILVASASWHLVERPLNELKRHFPYVREREVRS